jgi:dihydroorotate dehydrogenase electron transfer subunit
MPFEVPAEVIANTRLSPDYNVLSLAAPDIAQAAGPGQFVMVKPSDGLDPLLRRPFSIFEIVRHATGAPAGVSLLNKRVGRGTGQLYGARVGDVVSLVGPLGRPFVPVEPPAEAWMVAGGVGLAPFATLGDALAARRTPMTLFYGARSSADLHYASYFARLGARLALTTEDGTEGERGRVTAPLARALAATSQDRPVTIYACGPTPMMRAVADLGADAGRPVFVSLEPAWAAATAASCRCGTTAAATSCDPVSRARSSRPPPFCGTIFSRDTDARWTYRLASARSS